MSAIVSKTPLAVQDLESIALYIAQRNSDASHRFLQVAEQAFELLGSQPLLGERYSHPNYSDLRFWTLGRRFRNYVVFYRPTFSGVEIVRILHGAQNLPPILNQ